MRRRHDGKEWRHSFQIDKILIENQRLAGGEFSAVFKLKALLIPFASYQNVEKQAIARRLEAQF